MSDTYVKNRQKRSAPPKPFKKTICPGWWYTYPSEKYESVGMVIPFPTEWKVIKFHGSSHHQAVFEWLSCCWGPLFWYPEGP